MTVELQTLLDRSIDHMGGGMNSVVKESAIEVIKRAYVEKIYVQLSAGYRSIAEQNALYVKGRRGIRGENKVTNAKGGQSYHNYGLAVDYFLVSDDGNTALWAINEKWKRVAAIAKELGFEWGGDWVGFKDNPHLQMSGGLSIAQLQVGKRPNLVSRVPKVVVTNQAAETKEDDWLMELVEFPVKEMNDALSRVLLRFEGKEKPLDKKWREKLLKGELTGVELLGIYAVAIERGYITGKTE